MIRSQPISNNCMCLNPETVLVVLLGKKKVMGLMIHSPVYEYRNRNQALTFKDLDEVVDVPLVGDHMLSVQ